MPFVPSGSFFVSDPQAGSKLLKAAQDQAQRQVDNANADRLFQAGRQDAEDAKTQFFFQQNEQTKRLLLEQGFLDRRQSDLLQNRINISNSSNQTQRDTTAMTQAGANARNQATIEAANQRAAAMRAQEQQKIDNAAVAQRALSIGGVIDKLPKGSPAQDEAIFALIDIALPVEDSTAFRELQGENRQKARDVVEEFIKESKPILKDIEKDPQKGSLALRELATRKGDALDALVGANSEQQRLIAEFEALGQQQAAAAQAPIQAGAEARAKTIGTQAGLNDPATADAAAARAGKIASAEAVAKAKAKAENPPPAKPVVLNIAELRQNGDNALLLAGVLNATPEDEVAAIQAADRGQQLANQFGLNKAEAKNITATELAKSLDRVFTLVGAQSNEGDRFSTALEADTSFTIPSLGFRPDLPIPKGIVQKQISAKMKAQARAFINTKGQAGLDPRGPQWRAALDKALAEGGFTQEDLGFAATTMADLRSIADQVLGPIQ